jgi:hypothetical protein
MLDHMYAFEDALKLERKLLDERLERRATWQEQMPRKGSGSNVGGLRRRLARALLMLADRLDPRGVVGVPHVPTRPALNGTLHHA